MTNCAISSVQSDGAPTAVVTEDHSRIAISTNRRYIAKRPTP